ncbi:MAG: hypothetical protein VYE16_04030, partial [Cyanobacteriota bacterium]|nr:hypothetical protein [Cyanobacteriota bacterium]
PMRNFNLFVKTNFWASEPSNTPGGGLLVPCEYKSSDSDLHRIRPIPSCALRLMIFEQTPFPALSSFAWGWIRRPVATVPSTELARWLIE